MSTRTTMAVALLLGAAATACSSGGEPKTIRVTVTQTVTATPDGGSASADTSSSSETYAFGDPWEFESSDTADPFEGSVAVLGYKQGVTSVGSASEEAGESGYVWAYADLKVCSTKGSYTDDNSSWTLYYSDGSRVDPSSSTYDDFPKPEFPVQVTITAGKCARGKLVFPVPGGKRPAAVLYAPSGLQEPKEWTVPKA
ncbi:DUF4352 domain-containing protein [Streptomyces sp. NPDC090499]|uniref:DUF4352 domain-containing protein n=1 Tax=unclassified Streptomyces TaxID=2593676 RepID=UPI00382530B4